jgi:PAS domain S-box-containing protein
MAAPKLDSQTTKPARALDAGKPNIAEIMIIDSFSDTAPRWLRFAFAVLITLIAFFIRLKALPLDSGLQFLTVYPAVVICFYICGEGPGFFAIFFSCVLVFYGFFPPFFSLEPKPSSAASLSIYTLCALIIGFALTRMHDYRRRMVKIEQDLLAQARQIADEGLQLVVDGARIGIWRWNLEDNSLDWSDQCYLHFGIRPKSGMSYQKFIGLLHPDDQGRVEEIITKSIDQRQDYIAVYRAIWPDGSEHWIYALGRPYYASTGKVERMDGVLLDITEQRKIQQKAEEAASTLSAAFDSISDLLMLVDKHGNILRINESFMKLCGFATPDEVPKTVAGLEDIIEVETLEGVAVPPGQWPITRGMAGHRSEGVELRVKRKDNPANWLGSFNVCPISNSQNSGAVLIAHDITLLKQQEFELKHSLEQFTELAEAMPQIVWTTDAQGNNTYFNSHWMEYTGLTLEESYGSGWNLPFHPDDKLRAWNAWRSAVENDGSYSLECRIRRADGLYRWWLVRGAPAHDENGDIYKWFGTCTDIEEIKLAETAVRAALQYSRSLLEASLDPLVTISVDGKITDVNEATVKATGSSREALVGSDFSDYFTDPEKARTGYKEIFAKGSVTDYPLAIRHSSGAITDVLYNAALYYKDDGEIAGAFVAARDVTKLKRTEEELRLHREHLEELVKVRTMDLAKANKRLEAVNDELEAFAYSVSHDMRVPLRAIDGFSLILLEDYNDRLDAEGKRILNVIREGTVKISQLIDDILAFSRAGRIDLRSGTVDMNAVVESALNELAPTFTGRTIKIDVKPLEAANGDAAMIRRVWTNLIDNAIKFTARNSDAAIEIGSLHGEEETIYYVKDNGVGFDMKYSSKLFGIFQRLHGADFPGTGIGLAIVKRIVSRHLGRVWAEGLEGRGATLFFSLPLREKDHV